MTAETDVSQPASLKGASDAQASNQSVPNAANEVVDNDKKVEPLEQPYHWQVTMEGLLAYLCVSSRKRMSKSLALHNYHSNIVEVIPQAGIERPVVGIKAKPPARSTNKIMTMSQSDLPIDLPQSNAKTCTPGSGDDAPAQASQSHTHAVKLQGKKKKKKGKKSTEQRTNFEDAHAP